MTLISARRFSQNANHNNGQEALVNFAQRKPYFTQLWPSACGAQGWEPKDETKRHLVTRQCMLLCGGPDTDSITTPGAGGDHSSFHLSASPRIASRPEEARRMGNVHA
jgi:hypothetical protein